MKLNVRLLSLTRIDRKLKKSGAPVQQFGVKLWMYLMVKGRAKYNCACFLKNVTRIKSLARIVTVKMCGHSWDSYFSTALAIP